MKLLILKGLPASGKSTWAKKFCEENEGWVRVNRDDLRNMSGKYNYPKREKLITYWEDSCIHYALDLGYNVILDATNLNTDRNKNRVNFLKKNYTNLEVEYKFFDVSLEECIKRDSQRIVGKVGEKVIRNFYKRYLSNE